MGDFPDPDEEYELMYADEFELIKQNEQDTDSNVVSKKLYQAKRSLDFSSPVSKKTPLRSNEENTEDSLEQILHTQSTKPLEDVVISSNQSSKRTIDDLFGDVDDINFDEESVPSKRQKTDEEKDLELIERILEGRRLKQILSVTTGLAQTRKCDYDIKENISLNIPRWNFLAITNSDGERMYVKLESEESWENSLYMSSGNLLPASYADIWEEAKKIIEKKQEEQTRQESQQTQLPGIEEDVRTKLWVEKYKPESYVDLLSEEPVNRALLHWLHLWDKVVFKKEVKTKEPQQRSTFVKRTGQFQMTNKWKGKKEVEELDEDGRPHHKVALLCGPPGVGKTTLAHLLAKLAGYRPAELNASDERSVEAFRTALQSATSMSSVLDPERRPKCLILDEIDGAPLPTIELLVKWCTATGTEEGKKKVKTQPLRRPVIAICNDLYAPALRPLRPLSQIIYFGGVSQARLAARLTRVAESERLKAAPHALSALARRAGGDVRTAIQVLSFIRARRGQLTMDDVINANIGEKDCNKSLMQALQSIFTTIDDPQPVKACMSVISAHGEYDRIIDAIFENYLEARVDAHLEIACETLSWLTVYDELNAWTQQSQNYSVYGSLPLCAAACHRVLASRNPPKLKYPQLANEMYRKKMELDSIVDGVTRGILPSVVPSTHRALLLDVLSLLPYLLSPTLRSANIQLCSENEKKSLRTAAAAMLDYGLAYVQQRTPEGLYAFVMEPDIHKVAFFGTEERVRTSPAIRQALSREQQMENIRRTEAQAAKVVNKSSQAERPANTTKEKVAQLPNHLQRLKPKEVEKVTPQVQKDFFGRVVPIIECSQRSDAVRDIISSSSVFYQYQEGFNNAVRRSVRVRDLL